MAAIQNSAFELKVTNHEFDSVANITGVYHNGSDQPELCAAGFLCVRDELLHNDGYPVGVNNGNTWIMNAATDAADMSTPIYACNTFDVNQLTDMSTGEVYKVNANTLGLAVPANHRGTYTRINFSGDRIYRFGIGNANAEIGSNTFFTISDGMLVPAASAPVANGAVYFELVGTGNFTQGAWAAFGYIDVQAKHVVA